MQKLRLTVDTRALPAFAQRGGVRGAQTQNPWPDIPPAPPPPDPAPTPTPVPMPDDKK